MPQGGFLIEQNPPNIVTLGQFLRDLTVGIFAPLLLVTTKSLRGTLMGIGITELIKLYPDQLDSKSELIEKTGQFRLSLTF